MAPHAEPSKNKRKHGKGETKKERGKGSHRESRPSIQQWSRRFDELLIDHQVFATTQDSRVFFEFQAGFVKTAIWTYLWGPNQETLSRSVTNWVAKGSLPRRMEAVADELDQIAADWRTFVLALLKQLDTSVPATKRSLKYELPDVARDLPALLRLYATVLEHFSSITRRIIRPATRKTVASRALVWLFFGIKTFSERSANRTYSLLADLLDIGDEAGLDIGNNAGENADTTFSSEQIRERIRRFKEKQPDEFAWIQKHWRETTDPPEPSDFFWLITFGPALYRVGQK